MIRKVSILFFCVVIAIHFSCEQKTNTPEKDTMTKQRKTVVYQVFTRLFGNTNDTNKPWGTIEENGVGKFADFSEEALKEIKDLGVTHIWYTGVPHHALINDYTDVGISNDDPDVVKGRAGSPYAVKDYYNVNPDLAVNPENRLEEFKALIDRTHKQGMKVIIDIVPNHVARGYQGLTNPKGISDFGANDDTSITYHKNNNFYYIPDSVFRVPEWRDGYLPLGGERSVLSDDKFNEVPAKWTGNGSRMAQPDYNDWYETVKINYGVRPDGKLDFDVLPEDFENKNIRAHFDFWKDKEVPNSWDKFKDIALYWTNLGVDGFRYDMAEMVPVEFWSYMNSAIKIKNPDAFLLAEVYNPDLYRAYIHKGKMDYLYDKVELYDSIKHIMQGHGWTDHIPKVLEGLQDIEHHMLHFLENHDEQRIASSAFAGDAKKGMPAMVVSATSTTAPTMIYFGQETGESAQENAGFGSPTRTSIFDYIGVPSFQRWVNDKKFDGGQLTPDEYKLRAFYKRLLNFTVQSEALTGAYQDIHFFNKEHTESYDHRVLSYVRWSANEKLVVISNFDSEKSYAFDLKIPANIITEWKLEKGAYLMKDGLYGAEKELLVVNGTGHVAIELHPLESFILKVKE